jgi:hypothetical protein
VRRRLNQRGPIIRPAWRPARLALASGEAVASAPAAPLAPAARRVLKHPRLMPYQRLIAAVLLINVGILCDHLERGDWLIDDGSALSAVAGLTLVNFAAAVLIRQQSVLNVLFGLAGRGSRSWPLWLRWSVSKVHHVGGIHAGGALAGTAWLCAFACVATIARVRHPGSVSVSTLVLTYCLVGLAALVVVCAAPAVRSRAHNVFELSHRFGGWTAIALFWALMLHLSPPSWHVCVLSILTVSVASPWLRLRRVPVSVERPSAHAAIVRFDYGLTPAFASAVGISRSPLREWHAFATVATPGRSGYRLLISRAGDWTGRFIDDPPSHVWVRGIPTVAPMAKVALLYERVVYVVTGSGIGPVLGQILAARVPARLVWSTRDPRATYGDALVDEVEAAQPDAVVWDTTRLGKPDLLRLTRQAVRDFDAEAVFVVSNKATTLRLVHDLELLGIPAFGPIWDS